MVSLNSEVSSAKKLAKRFYTAKIIANPSFSNFEEIFSTFESVLDANYTGEIVKPKHRVS